MSSAEKRSGVDGDDEIVGTRDLGLELGATDSDAVGRLSSGAIRTDAVEVGGVCEAQERGNAEMLVEVDGKDMYENQGIEDGSNDYPSTNNSSHSPDQNFGIESGADGLRKEASRGNEGHEIVGAHVIDDSDRHNASSGSNLDVDEYDDDDDDDGVYLREHEESEEEENEGEESSGDCCSDHPDILSRSEIDSPRFVRWPIECSQVAEETCTEISAHYNAMSELEASASGGCPLCALFVSKLYLSWENHNSRAHAAGNHLPPDQLKPYRMTLERNSGISYNLHEGELLWNISLDFWMVKDGIRGRESAYAMIVLDNTLDSEHRTREYHTNTDLGQNAWESFQLGCTKESTDLVRAWLRECCLGHSACRQQEKASALPTRLIKIDSQEIRLCKSANENCSNWRAPSWSWAAVKQPVSISSDETVVTEAYIEITKVDVTLEHDDPFGGVKRGVLNVRSRSMIIYKIKSPFDKYSGRSIGKISIRRYALKWDYTDCGSEGFWNSILILPVGILKAAGTEYIRIEGILLRHTGQEDGQYERLGHFMVLKMDPHYELICRAMNLAQDEQFRELGLGDALPSEKDYISTDVDEDGITWYAVSIV
ncbi:uncharacterized protein EAF01_005545 [Botrytis porri]|uniref:uncharacterized protein n=1 Tax=Botrytis porri TaxID=87229 RepID=UPI0019010E57|nr:uncharacterized protein EAF01_005545 [Botrytis porri]KAF7905023.1 hypothetical protein EAF01_005545 [Botrytis porri]